MAFTELELKDARSAIGVGAKPEDLFKLGLMYSTEMENRGPDYIEAHKWFNLAAMMGSRPAAAYRAELATEMTSGDVAQALRAARSWLSKNRNLVAA